MALRLALFALLAFAALGIAGAGLTLLPTQPKVTAAAPPPPKVEVLVAAAALRGGSLIRPQDLHAVEMLASEVPDGATLDGPQQRTNLTGAMVRRALSENQPILPSDVVRPGDHGFLAAVLQPGMRAVTVAVDAVSGTAGLIWPGDRVDVIMTQSLDEPSLPSGHRVAAQTILSDARVIAIDQQLVRGQPPDGTTPTANRTATLEVTPLQVERVLVAGKLGHLSLSVLSADQPSARFNLDPQSAARSNALASVTWGSDVSPALTNTEAHAPPLLMHVFQGDGEAREFHF
jgi:pilus assembly protein CpaB